MSRGVFQAAFSIGLACAGSLAAQEIWRVDNIAKVSEVATPDVPATSHPIALQNVFRPDAVGDLLTPAQVLQNAPDAADGRFRVTAILGEEQ